MAAVRDPCLLNPITWQVQAAQSDADVRRLHHLDAIRARLSASTSTTEGRDAQMQQALHGFGCLGYGLARDLCDMLSGPRREAFAAFGAQYFGRDAERLLVVKYATDAWGTFRPNCTSLACRGGLGALGNNLGSYAIARAAAMAGNLDFVDVRELCTSDETLDIMSLLPAVAPAPRHGTEDRRGRANLSAATSLACAAPYNVRAMSWDGYMPAFRRVFPS